MALFSRRPTVPVTAAPPSPGGVEVVADTLDRLGRADTYADVTRAVLDARHLACDPLPSPTRVNTYDADFFRGAEEALRAPARSRKANERLLQQLIPDPVFRRQMQDFWAAHPGFQRQFPGGFVHFAQVLHQIGPEAVEDLMIQVADQAQGAGDGMPGGFMPMDGMLGDFAEGVPEGDPADAEAVAEEDEHEEDDEEDDEEEEVAVSETSTLAHPNLRCLS